MNQELTEQLETMMRWDKKAEIQILGSPSEYFRDKVANGKWL